MRNLDKATLAQRSLIKKYRKEIWNPFIAAIKRYRLIQENDRIAVCISGGKDSMILAKLMQQLKLITDVPFELEFLVMDPGYNAINRKKIEENAELLRVPITVFESNVFEASDVASNGDSPCYLCARMRRGALYRLAEELGCNKIALGHHFDDVIETTLMNMLNAGSFQTMMPKLHSTNFEGLELIRPLYYIEEDYIKRFTNNAGIWPLNCACMVAAKKTGNKRYEIKDLIKSLGENFKDVEKSIFKAAENVNIDSVLGWQQDGVKHSFLQNYEKNFT